MAVNVKVPSVGESITEVTIANWTKENGSFVNLDEVICEIESDKATIELTAECAGKLKIIKNAGDTVPVGHIIAEIDPTASKGTAPATANAATTAAMGSSAQPAPSSDTKVASGTKESKDFPSPAAKKILEEKGISPQQVAGTGKDGRITKADAQGVQVGTKAAPDKNAQVLDLNKNVDSLASTSTSERGTRREKMTTLRSTIARRLVAVKNTTAMLTTFNEIDMWSVMEVRKKYKDIFKEKHQVGLGFMSFFTKAAVMALREFPAINAIIDGSEIVFHNYFDVGIAVSAPRGLVVPVVRNCEKLSLAQIEKEILRLAGKARDNKISIDEMSGGTFTITNGGVFGSMLSTPILNAPQSGILGMHNIVERPVALHGQVVIRPIMYVALSYDHRIVDGRESVGFLKMVKELVEDPTRLLLEV